MVFGDAAEYPEDKQSLLEWTRRMLEEQWEPDTRSEMSAAVTRTTRTARRKE